MNNSPRILVIRLSALGDLIQSTRHIQGFRRHWPNAHVTLLSEPLGVGLFANGGFGVVDEVILWRRKVSWREDWQALKRLRQQRFDYAFDLHSKVQTGVALSLARACRKGRIVSGPLVKALLGRHVPAAKTASGMLRQAGIVLDADEAARIDAAPPALKPSQAVLEQAAARLSEAGLCAGEPFAAFAPGSSPGWPSKRWPPEAFSALAKNFADLGLRTVLLGTADERALGQQIRQRAPNVIDLIGQTQLAELVAVLARARVAVTNDSGPMHIAAVLTTPTLALFGPTDSERHGPDHFYGSPHQALSSDATCSPCYQGQCPLSKQICMHDISVEHAWQTLQRMLSEAT